MRVAAAAVGGLAALAAVIAQPFGSSKHDDKALALLHPKSAYSQQPIVVDVYEYGFQPTTVVIRAGQAVAWKDVGRQFHVVTASSPAGRRVFDAAKDIGSAAHVFPRPGRYPYHCVLHPQMRGTVVVHSASKSGSRPSY